MTSLTSSERGPSQKDKGAEWIAERHQRGGGGAGGEGDRFRYEKRIYHSPKSKSI